MANITLEQLRALPKAAEISEVVEMPEWGEGVSVRIRALSLTQREEILREGRVAEGQVDMQRWNAMVLKAGMADPVLKYDDALTILELAHEPVQRLINRIWTLSGMTPEGQIAKAAVDAAEAQFRE